MELAMAEGFDGLGPESVIGGEEFLVNGHEEDRGVAGEAPEEEEQMFHVVSLTWDEYILLEFLFEY